jgi:Spy/CpxP family protein refolding chaperone
MNYCAKFFVAMLFVSLLPMTAAQAQKRNPAKEDRPGLDRIESFKKVRLLEILKLDEATSAKFMARYNRRMEKMRAAEGVRGEIVDKLEQQVASNASEADLAQTFAALADQEKKMFEKRVTFISDLKEILTPQQVAQFIVFERTFNRDLRNIVRDVQKSKGR